MIRAVNEINRTIFGSTERRDHRVFKIIALTRTDIFIQSQMVNVTSKIRDNSVELNWTNANENEFTTSKLFKMINRILGWKEGEENREEKELFYQYFNFRVHNRFGTETDVSTFIQRQSRLRPRDIVVMLRIIQDECKNKQLKNPTAAVIESSGFRLAYAIYYAIQIKS